jgi:peptidoglycan-N-acetylglucosamine deacetylase
VLDRSIAVVEQLSGKYSCGDAVAWWELSPSTTDLLQKKGLKYDHSRMHQDFEPYHVRRGDTWTTIDYSSPPSIGL